MKYIYVTYLFILLALLSCNESKKLEINSPDGKIQVIFDNSNSKLNYSVSYNENEIISKSKLGFDFKNQHSFDSILQIENFSIRTFDTVWEQPWGEQQFIREHYNELNICFTEKGDDKRKFSIIFRVFDDGIGFRYVFPKQDNLDYFEITNEKTEFNFSENTKAWWIKSFTKNRYEQLYQLTDINDVDTAHTPITIETSDGVYVSIHEAELTDYAAMSLAATKKNGFQCCLSPWSDGIKVKATAPHQTPWRTIQIAKTPGDLIASNLILNLNPPNVLGDVSWLKPMKYIGIWWGIHIGKWSFGPGINHGATTERAKEYIDFAFKNGFDEILVEGWDKGWPSDVWFDNGAELNFIKSAADYDLAEVQKYAKSKGVSIQIYHETMANTVNYLDQIDTAFNLLSDIGIQSAKIGHVGFKLDQKEYHDSQYGVNYFRKVLKKAAEHKISVNFHEPIKATGERRTYPNMFSREGARGQEYNAWSEGNPPEHTCILPFTRLLAGPMDFTPGIFDVNIKSRPYNRVKTTLAKQLALYVVIYSPIQMAADLIENYQNNPAFQFIKDVPVDWETTKVIDAKIGDYVIVARKDKNNEDWYLGAITDENERVFKVKLDFLDSDKRYEAQIYRDADVADYINNSTAYEIDEKLCEKGEILECRLAKGGGMAVRFKAIE